MEKAQIIVLAANGLIKDYVIPCQLNPSEYSYSKQNSWKQASSKGREVPNFEFSSGQPATLKMQLIFDTTDSGEDVRTKHTEKIWNLMRVPEKHKGTGKGEPPKCIFMWGGKKFFTAVITSLTQKFTYFAPSGLPLRATLDLTFQQIKDDGD